MNQVLISPSTAGIVTMALSYLLGLFHYQIDAETQAGITEWIVGAGNVIGGALVIYDRIKSVKAKTALVEHAEDLKAQVVDMGVEPARPGAVAAKAIAVVDKAAAQADRELYPIAKDDKTG